MRKIHFAFLFSLICVTEFGFAQQTASTTQQAPPATKYDYHDLFAPFFYSKNGNSQRAATGEPGQNYWQNRADYILDVKLNEETDEISGSEILTYTNNSPLKMNFIWMQLDQNLFKKESRGSAIVPIKSKDVQNIPLHLVVVECFCDLRTLCHYQR